MMPGDDKCTIAEAIATAAQAIDDHWDDIAPMVDETSDPRSWLRHLLGEPGVTDDLLLAVAGERLTMLAAAIRMAHNG